METNFKLGNLEVSIDDSALHIKTQNPFSVHTVEKPNFSGIHVGNEKVLPRSDWNYAFRFGGVGILLMVASFGIGYNVSGGAQGGLGLAFVYLGVVFAQLITFGALILLLTFWDAFFGTQISHKMLLKLFGKVQLKVIVASKQNDNLEFFLDPATERQNLDKLLEATKSFK